MKVAAIRHVAFEDLGLLENSLAESGWEIYYFDAGVDDLKAPLRNAGLAVILGGPIGVYEEDRYPFLVTEKNEIEKRLAACKPTLGICLGAQLMASALGARVYSGGKKEIGWKEIGLTDVGHRSSLSHFSGKAVLHWHGDTFELPVGATHLASTGIYENQAFSIGTHALALQFHAEVDVNRIERWLIGHTCELTAAGLNIPRLRSQSRSFGSNLRSATRAFFRDWIEQATPNSISVG